MDECSCPFKWVGNDSFRCLLIPAVFLSTFLCLKFGAERKKIMPGEGSGLMVDNRQAYFPSTRQEIKSEPRCVEALAL